MATVGKGDKTAHGAGCTGRKLDSQWCGAGHIQRINIKTKGPGINIQCVSTAGGAEERRGILDMQFGYRLTSSANRPGDVGNCRPGVPAPMYRISLAAVGVRAGDQFTGFVQSVLTAPVHV